jgi:hypothetical protein
VLITVRAIQRKRLSNSGREAARNPNGTAGNYQLLLVIKHPLNMRKPEPVAAGISVSVGYHNAAIRVGGMNIA